MNARRLSAFVDSLRRNRRPKAFTPDADDVEAMRAAIELNNAQPGAALRNSDRDALMHKARQIDAASQLNKAHLDNPVEVANIAPIPPDIPAISSDRRDRLTAGPDAAIRFHGLCLSELA